MLKALALVASAAALVAPPTARRATLLRATVAEATGGANAALIDDLAARTKDARLLAEELLPCDDETDVRTWLARFLGDDGDVDAAEAKVRESLEWRTGSGRAICEAARDAVAEATANGAWSNAPVQDRAPHGAKINAFFAGGKVMNLRNKEGDGLIYAIRAGDIDDKALMASVSVEEVAEFFLYAKAINERACAALSKQTGTLATVTTANDLAGVDLFGDASFRNALSSGSKQGDLYFPGLSGPTLLLNLPRLLGVLVKLFTPLFPPAVRAKLRFERHDLGAADSLSAAAGRTSLVAYVSELLG
jgi:hypothetical protein